MRRGEARRRRRSAPAGRRVAAARPSPHRQQARALRRRRSGQILGIGALSPAGKDSLQTACVCVCVCVSRLRCCSSIPAAMYQPALPRAAIAHWHLSGSPQHHPPRQPCTALQGVHDPVLFLEPLLWPCAPGPAAALHRPQEAPVEPQTGARHGTRRLPPPSDGRCAKAAAAASRLAGTHALLHTTRLLRNNVSHQSQEPPLHWPRHLTPAAAAPAPRGLCDPGPAAGAEPAITFVCDAMGCIRCNAPAHQLRTVADERTDPYVVACRM
jgi:hypothetical protein